MTLIEGAPLPVEKRSRIQTKNRAALKRAALEVFARDGFPGATLKSIADAADMSKTNLLYYFSTKDEIYKGLLEDLLVDWLAPLAEFDAAGDPIEQISGYIERKITLARDLPLESRLFANEMIRGAPILSGVLSGDLKALVDEKSAVIKGWMDEGRLASIDPYHLIFAIWATTQHYADFDVQVCAILEDNSNQRFVDAATALQKIFLDGLRPR